MQIEQDGAGDLDAIWTRPRGARTAVGALDIVVAAFHKIEEAVDRVEDVAAIGKTDEGLRGRDSVPLHACFDQVIAHAHGDVVEELDAGIAVIHRNKKGHAKAVRARKIHRRIGKWARGSGVDRPVVRTRAILPGELEPELVDRVARQQRYQTAVESVRPIPFHCIRAARPRIHVKGAVFLLGPGVIVFEGGRVVFRQVVVDLGEKSAGVIGAVDGAIVAC